MAVESVRTQKTIQEIIDSTSNKKSERNTGALGKEDFLNLLVTQLRYQDPLNPMEDKEFIAQMAQFNALEQMQNLNTSMTQSQAFSLIGKYIAASTTDSQTLEPKIVSGLVTNVKLSNGKTFVVVNGEDIEVDRITDVTSSDRLVNDTNLSAYTNLLGHNVKAAVYDPKTSNVVGVDGIVVALEKGAYEDYAVVDNVTVDISGVITDTPSADPEFIENYLKERLPEAEDKPGKEVELWVVDRKNNQKVPVKAILKSYTKDEETGTIKVTLDKVYVPVDSVAQITK